MASPYWIRSLINKTFSQRFFWAKLTNYPIIGRIIDYALFDKDEILYLPKERSIPVNVSLEQPDSLAAPSRVVEHFIKSASTRWIMDFCICRDSARCKDYPIDLGCIFLGEAAKGINPKFGHIASEQEALDHAERCREAGLVHMIGKNKLDSVWLNVSPSDRLMTICNCCPCCCLWKVLPVISTEIGNKLSRMPGVSVHVTDRCTGCGTCTRDVCFVDAIRLENDHAVIDQTACRGCGRCVDVCPNNAIEVVIEDDNFIERTIERLSDAVDVT